jgi:hypothetical protein
MISDNGSSPNGSRKGARRRILLSDHAPATHITDTVNVSLKCIRKLGINVVPAVTPNLYVNGKKYIQHFVAPSKIYSSYGKLV